MITEYRKLIKNRPIAATAMTIGFFYSAKHLYDAFTKPKDEFWPWDINGIGASTSTTSSSSASHAMMPRQTSGDLMSHPSALFGIGATASSSSRHAHLRTSTYGEDTYTSPQQLYGVPNAVKRRVMVNDIGDHDEESYVNPLDTVTSTTEVSAEEAEILAGAGGWI